MNKIDKSLPVYEVIVSEEDETGVKFISLVDRPAIEVDWHAFSEQKKVFRFEKVGDQQKLAGPFLIPNLPIYRVDEKTKEAYYMTFSEKSIQILADKFNGQANNKNINVEHQPGSQIDAYVSENWIVEDPKHDKSAKYGFDLPKGSWFGLVKIQDPTLWNDYIKAGELKGFSIEGMLGITKVKNSIQTQMEKTEIKLTEVKTKEGAVLYTPDEVLAVGSEIFVVAEDGTQTPYPDGDTELESGEVLRVKDGKVAEIIAASNDQPAPVEESAVEASEEALAEYPGGWDQCVIDMTEKYGSEKAAKNICGAIKAGTVQHNANLAKKEETPVIAEGAQGPTGPVGPTGVQGTPGKIVEEMVAELSARIKVLEDANTAKTEAEAKLATVTAEFAAFKKEVEEKFSKVPGAPAVTKKNDAPVAKPKQTLADRINKMKEISSALK